MLSTGQQCRRWTKRLAVFAGAVSLALGGSAPAGTAQVETNGDPYPLERCPVSGEKLGSMGDPVVYDHQGREVRFCCKDCIKKFTAEPAKYLEKLDDKIVERQRPDYPLDTCLVSGKKLGSVGEPFEYVHNNRLVRFCCKGCVRGFEEDPSKYLAKLDQAVIDKQKKDYPLETCVVSGEKLGSVGEPADYVVWNRLVRFCCKGCVKRFNKDPLTYLAKLGSGKEPGPNDDD